MLSFFSNFFLLILIFPCKISSDPRGKCRNGVFNDVVVSIQTEKVHRCNGVILNKNTVITTALCMTDHLYRVPNSGCDCKRELNIIYNLKMAHLLGLYCARQIGVEQTFIHKHFHREAKSAIYDVAILKTKGNMILEPDFVPPVLPEKRNSSSDVCEEDAVVAGFWMDGNQKEPNAKMACLDVTVKNLRNCEKLVGASLRPDSLACTHDKSVKVAGLCKGYFGAPLLCKEKKNVTVLRGLISHRFGLLDECGSSSPVFYTRVDHVLDFIKKPEA